MFRTKLLGGGHTVGYNVYRRKSRTEKDWFSFMLLCGDVVAQRISPNNFDGN